MSSRTRPPSGVTANTLGAVATPEDVGASSHVRLAAVGAGVFESIDGHPSQWFVSGSMTPRGIIEAR
jgi:hypothetical protein